MVPSGAVDPLAALSRRERDVLACATDGLTNAQIAQAMDITVSTVKFHLASVYRKLGAGNRTEAIVMWVRAQPSGPAANERGKA